MTIKPIWIDLETTGLDPDKNSIIEFAAVYEDEVFHKYSLPHIKPDDYYETKELTGIAWEFLEVAGLSEKELYRQFLIFLDSIVDKFDKTDKLIFSGYGTRFDVDFTRELFNRNNNNFFGSYFFSVNFDVMSEVAYWLLNRDIIPLPENFKLKTICNYFGIDFNAHSAIEDIQATIKLFNKLQECRISWIEEEDMLRNDIGIKQTI